MAGTVCVVCRHRKADRGQVCGLCVARIVDQLTDLPRKMRGITLQLVPSGTGLGTDRITHVRTDAPIPVRMDALTLAGPGGDGLSAQAVAAMMHPAVRRWTTESTVTVTVPAGADGLTREEERTLTEWHQELAVDDNGRALVVVDDDQVGILPPAEWLDLWVRHWKVHFGHHVPHQPPTGAAGRLTGAARRIHGRAARERAAATALGLIPGYGGTLPAAHRPDDPLEVEWETRFGRQHTGWWAGTDVAYLLAFLDAACDQDVGIAAFAAELRSLDAELVRVLGELPDQQWIGRCPATLTGHDDDTTTKPCGAGLWQDPHASQIMCPRCRSTWGPRRIELFHLATAIRKVWPLDRRRRYTLGETLQVPTLHCVMCASELVVAWTEVTAIGDTERWWRPARVVCPMHCTNPGRFL